MAAFAGDFNWSTQHMHYSEMSSVDAFSSIVCASLTINIHRRRNRVVCTELTLVQSNSSSEGV